MTEQWSIGTGKKMIGIKAEVGGPPVTLTQEGEIEGAQIEEYPDGEQPVTEEEAKGKVDPPNEDASAPLEDDLPATPEEEEE